MSHTQKGIEAARNMLIGIALRSARELRDASKNCFEDEPEAAEAWDALNEALTAIDDFATTVASRETEPAPHVEGRQVPRPILSQSLPGPTERQQAARNFVRDHMPMASDSFVQELASFLLERDRTLLAEPASTVTAGHVDADSVDETVTSRAHKQRGVDRE